MVLGKAIGELLREGIRSVQSSNLPAALTALGAYQTAMERCIRTACTRQPQDLRKYYVGQRVFDETAAHSVYPSFAFVTAAVDYREVIDVVGNPGSWGSAGVYRESDARRPSSMQTRVPDGTRN